MSTWISRRAGAAVVFGLALSLGGCDPSMFGVAPASMSVAGGAVVVAGPPGFCVDSGASHSDEQGSFVLLGSCASISGSASADKPPIRAILTAAVSAGARGASIRGAEDALTLFFRSAPGRTVLSRSGDPSTVRVLSIAHTDGVVVLHARDTSPFPGQAVTPDYWRALFDLNGHIVTLNVIGVPQAPFSDASGLKTLEQFVGAVRASSPAEAPAAPASPAPAG